MPSLLSAPLPIRTSHFVCASVRVLTFSRRTTPKTSLLTTLRLGQTRLEHLPQLCPILDTMRRPRSPPQRPPVVGRQLLKLVPLKAPQQLQHLMRILPQRRKTHVDIGRVGTKEEGAGTAQLAQVGMDGAHHELEGLAGVVFAQKGEEAWEQGAGCCEVETPGCGEGEEGADDVCSFVERVGERDVSVVDAEGLGVAQDGAAVSVAWWKARRALALGRTPLAPRLPI